MQETGYLKRCTKCGATNREVKFYKYRAKVCAPCEQKRAAEWRIENQDKISVYTKLRWQRIKNNPEKLKKEAERVNANKRKRYAESADVRYKQKERLRAYRARRKSASGIQSLAISQGAGATSASESQLQKLA